MPMVDQKTLDNFRAKGELIRNPPDHLALARIAEDVTIDTATRTRATRVLLDQDVLTRLTQGNDAEVRDSASRRIAVLNVLQELASTDLSAESLTAAVGKIASRRLLEDLSLCRRPPITSAAQGELRRRWGCPKCSSLRWPGGHDSVCPDCNYWRHIQPLSQ
jgi:hypothetical protein